MSDNKFYKCGNLRPDDQKSNTMLSIKKIFIYISSLVLLFLSIGLLITMIKRSMHIKVQKEIQFLLFIKVNKTNLFYLVYYCSGYFWHSCWILKSSVMYFYKIFKEETCLNLVGLTIDNSLFSIQVIPYFFFLIHWASKSKGRLGSVNCKLYFWSHSLLTMHSTVALVDSRGK